jgi:acetyl-CoA acetyltransferase
MYYEALGMCGRGEGAAMIERSDCGRGGRRPVNPSGGLVCRLDHGACSVHVLTS